MSTVLDLFSFLNSRSIVLAGVSISSPGSQGEPDVTGPTNFCPKSHGSVACPKLKNVLLIGTYLEVFIHRLPKGMYVIWGVGEQNGYRVASRTVLCSREGKPIEPALLNCYNSGVRKTGAEEELKKLVEVLWFNMDNFAFVRYVAPYCTVDPKIIQEWTTGTNRIGRADLCLLVYDHQAITALTLKQRKNKQHQCSMCLKDFYGAKACEGCEEVRYCSLQCQKKHWKDHKLVCAKRATR